MDPRNANSENKYCLKANYIDYSQSRNVVSGKIFGEIVKSSPKILSEIEVNTFYCIADVKTEIFSFILTHN